MVSCLMGDSTALASAIVRCCLRQYFVKELFKQPKELVVCEWQAANPLVWSDIIKPHT